MDREERTEEEGRKMGQIIAKAWKDDAFKRRLLTDATAVLKEEGIEIPAGMEVRALENTDKVFHLVIPPKPSPHEITDDQLQMVAGGTEHPTCDLFGGKGKKQK